MHLRDTTQRKHVHLWAITKRSTRGWHDLRLQRTCASCGANQWAIEFDPPNLPPEPLLALAELTWTEGKL